MFRYSSTSTGFHKKVLIAVDGSKHSDYAFEWYVDNIKRYGDFVILLHCIDVHSPTELATDSNGGDMFANLTKEGRAHEQEFQDKFTKKMKDARLHGLVKKDNGIGKDRNTPSGGGRKRGFDYHRNTWFGFCETDNVRER